MIKTMARSAILAVALVLALTSCSQKVVISSPRYALAYGIQDYPGTINDLSYTVSDSDSMKSILSGEGWNVTETTNSGATKAKIASDIASLSTISSDSTVLIYYSGHGTIYNKTACIVPYDSIVAHNEGLSSETATIVPGNLLFPADLWSYLAGLPTKNVIVIFDSCFSGGFVSSGSATDVSPQDYSQMPSFSAFSSAWSQFGSLLSANASASGQKSPIVISAAGSEEYSYDGTVAMNHGVFTYFLLQAVNGGDGNSDGVVTTTEAFAYTQKSIMSWDASSSDIGYTPFLPHISGGTRDLVLFTP